MTINTSSGFITLVSIAVAGAVGLGIALSILLAGSIFSKDMIVMQQSAQASALADSCTEEALQQLRTNTAFTGSGSLSLGGGTCTYLVAVGSGVGTSTSRTVTSSGTVGTIVRKVSAVINNINTFTNVSSWQEVGG